MKNLFLTFVVFSVLLIIGCQENNITEPASTELANKVQGGEITRGAIILDQLLIAPGYGNEYYQVNGRIDFVHEIYVEGESVGSYIGNIKLNLSVDASVNNLESPPQERMFVSSKTEDRVYVIEEGSYLLEKIFKVQGDNNGMALVCRFIVTTVYVGLYDVLLSFTDGGGSLSKDTGPGNTITYPPVKINVHQ